MDNCFDERDYKLLENDKYTFFVLTRIMGVDCELKLSDHERMIICFTNSPFPVWIWTPDDASKEEMDKVYDLAKEHGLLDGKHTFNLKYELAEHFIKRAAEEINKLSIQINMFAYDCLNSIKPTGISDGRIHKCTEDDIEELVTFMDLFHKEVGIDKQDEETYRMSAKEFVKQGNMYFWKNAKGESVACCKFEPTGDMASINLVFTPPEHRRKHYAENLVYQVTEKAREAGFVPMLYTNADYVASNKCYEKIGYVLRGKLCTIGSKQV